MGNVVVLEGSGKDGKGALKHNLEDRCGDPGLFPLCLPHRIPLATLAFQKPDPRTQAPISPVHHFFGSVCMYLFSEAALIRPGAQNNVGFKFA